MNYAKKIHQANKTAKRPKAKRDTPTFGIFLRFHAKAKRRKRNTKRPPTVCSRANAPHAFLKTSFYPKLDAGDAFPNDKKTKVQRDFFKSLALISEVYQLAIPDAIGLDYPYNIITSWTTAREQLKEKTKEWANIRLIQENGDTFFAKQQTFDTGRTLYYIPVVPLFLVLKDPVKRRGGLLLQAICAHLYIVSDIAYYTMEITYMEYVYSTIGDWLLEEDDVDEDIAKDLNIASKVGAFIQQKVNNRQNLTRFQKRIDSFAIKNNFDLDCHDLALRFFKFINDYPETRLDEHFKRANTESEDSDYDTGSISLENYVSFYSSASGDLSHQVIDFVNTDLQELCHIDEPVLYKPFDNRKMNKVDFSFEQGIFDLIEELISLLHKIEQKDERYYK